jgi:trimeric autotransporter adhesin
VKRIININQSAFINQQSAVKLLVLLLTINYQLLTVNCFPQNGVSVNMTGAAADNSAILDISSSSQGLLIPRMTTMQRDGIASPALSLLIFNTTTNCFEAYVNGQWYSISCPQAVNDCTGSGLIITIAGTGVIGYNGDGIPANSAELNYLAGVAVDMSGNVYIADEVNDRIRKITVSTGIISTVAGNSTEGYNGDGIAATDAELHTPTGVALDGSGNIYFVDNNNNRVRKVTLSNGLISTIAGNGTPGFNGDGIPATNAEVYSPIAVAIDQSGNVYIADTYNQKIRKVTASTGIISTVAGNGTVGYNGDGIAATGAELNYPYGIALDGPGNLYIGDYDNNRVRKVDVSTGIISTIAGTGTGGYNSDGIAATAAKLYLPSGVVLDASGNVYIGDYYNHRIRMVNVSTGLISTIAGNGQGGYSGDGLPATSAELQYPWGVALDNEGNVYIADHWNHRVRKVCH